ncbi:MAG TPA: hypothetical protein VFP35_02505 [Candidatus Saccharimonadales bacterium]|nr:hypothetical protein [Candidatus Saccharimonadales bacterium]
MKNFRLRIISAFSLIVLALFTAGLNAFAQSNGLGVTPKQSYTMTAGQTASNSLFLSNLNKSESLTVHISVVDFEAQNQTGAAKLLQASDQPQTPWSLKPYLTIPDVVTVPPGQSTQVPFTVKLPANVGAGTYYSAIEYTATRGATQQQVNIAASTATLLFINVPGDVSELMTLQDFGFTNSNKDNASYVSLFHTQPEYYAYRIKNSGNVAEQPAGSIIIKNIFGKTVAHVDTANPKGQIALIGQTRRLTGCNPKSTAPERLPLDTNCVPLHLAPGFYTATLAVFYGQNGQQTRQIGATAHFWYLPWGWLIAIIIIIILILILLYFIYRRLARVRHRRR